MKFKLHIFFILFAVVGCSTNSSVTTKPTSAINLERPKKSSVFDYKSELGWVRDLSAKANCTISKPEFIAELSAVEKFDYDPTNSTGKNIADALQSGKCIISTYRTKNRWSSAIATTWRTDRTTLYLNLRKNPREISSMINTVMHECLHLKGFSHGSNSPRGKQDSVNFKAGSIAQRHACK